MRRPLQRKRKSIYGKTREEVAKKLTKALADHRRGLPLPDERETVAQFLTRWLDGVARHTLRPSTFRRYHELVTLHAIPAIGKVRLAHLTPQHLAHLYGERLKAGLSPRTVQFLHAVLHRAFKQAAQWNLLARNPADAVQAPQPERKDIAPLTHEQVVTLLHAVEDDPLEALIVLAVTTGMRLGELLGLQWSDIEGNRLHVRHTLQRIDKRWVLQEPKSALGRRSITLSALAVGALKRHRARPNEQRLVAGPAWEDWGLVFCDDVGRPLDQGTVLKRFRRILARAGLPRIRFHDLRHTCATLLLAQGVHPKKVHDLLGHSTISVTLDTYSHVLPNLQDEVATAMDGLLGRARASG